MRKEAIGIAINGREVKIAHVFRDKYRLGVDFLESAVLSTDIDAELKKKEEQPPDAALLNEGEDLFTTKSPYSSKSPLEKETGVRENVDILYSLLSKFAANKIKVAFNISPARVTYQDLDTHLDYNKNVFKGNLKKKIEGWKKGFNAMDNVSVITRSDGTLCNVFCETYQPPILDILEQLNSFFKGNLFLSLMDSNEVALVNLARAGYNFDDPNKITAIVQIETEFSRIIFMKGEDILTVSPIVNESFNPEIINIVYSKIIYELDNSNIPEIGNILLAGRASSATARAFFEKKFPDAKVGFIIAQPLAENLSAQFSREDLSSFAIPISLAWKAIEPENRNFIATNLLPTQFVDRQKMLTLSLAGYALLILLGLTAFIMTWKITAKKIEISDLRREGISLQQQINSSESTVNRVHEIEAEIARIRQRIVLSDSLSAGADKLLTFLEKLNQSVLKINSVWIEEIKNTPNGILVRGMSLKRGDIPRLSEELGGAKINKLVRSGSGNGQNFAFEMEVSWLPMPSKFSLPKSFAPETLPPLKKTAIVEPPASGAIIATEGSSSIVKQRMIAEQDKNRTDRYNPPASSRQAEPPVARQQTNKFDIKSQSKTAASRSSSPQRQTRIAEQQAGRADGYNPPSSSRQPEPLIAQQETKKFDVKPKTQATASGHRPPQQPTREAGLTPKIETSSSPQASFRNDHTGQAGTKYRPKSDAHYAIKISAHANQLSANKEVELYLSKGVDTYITQPPNANRTLPYWVCYGDFDNYEEAQSELDILNGVIPGRRTIIELPKNKSFNESATPLSRDAPPANLTDNGAVIKTAKHTVLSTADAATARPSNLLDSSAGSFTVRISAHATRFTATKEMEFYRSRGYETYITRLPEANPDIPYSVCLGNFSSYADAENKIKELKQVIPRSYSVARIR